MTIMLNPEIVQALTEAAHRRGINPEAYLLDLLHGKLGMASTSTLASLQPADEWEEKLLSMASDCGTSLSNEAVSSEGLYE